MKCGKKLSILLVVVLLLTMGSGVGYAQTSGAGFSDIHGHWAESIINEAASLGLVGGYPDGTFLPDNLIKREEFFKLLTNILTITPDTSNTTIQFTDVVDYEWYVPTVKIAVAGGMASGYGDGTFGIGCMISRQEAAKVVGSVIPSTGSMSSNSIDSLKDKSSIADWAYPYVELMFKKGYMKGDTDGDFRPTMALTRAEAAAILLSVKKNETIIAAHADEVSSGGCIAQHAGEDGVFVNGSGTKNDPYEITNEAQLNHMRKHADEGAYFVITRDIAVTRDFAVTSTAIDSVADWTQGNFEPIGSKEEPFRGHISGGDYTISGLVIAGTKLQSSGNTAADDVGLFGYLAQDSDVEDLVIDASEITGNQYVGAIAGYNEGTIENCRIRQNVVVSGKTDIGGIAGGQGNESASIIKCSNDGEISGNSAAGIVGNNRGTVSHCFNSGSIKAGTGGGGIAAYQGDGEGLVTKCYNEGSVYAEDYAGGIIGINTSVVSNCYHSGKVRGTDYIGGIAGRNSGTIAAVYCAGTVTGKNETGGLAGANSGSLGCAFWLSSVGETGVGVSEDTASQTLVAKVTYEQLTGQKKINTTSGYKMLIELMNSYNEDRSNIQNGMYADQVWKYLYVIEKAANVSDTADNEGNTIQNSDLTTKYLYPGLIKE